MLLRWTPWRRRSRPKLLRSGHVMLEVRLEALRTDAAAFLGCGPHPASSMSEAHPGRQGAQGAGGALLRAPFEALGRRMETLWHRPKMPSRSPPRARLKGLMSFQSNRLGVDTGAVEERLASVRRMLSVRREAKQELRVRFASPGGTWCASACCR